MGYGQISADIPDESLVCFATGRGDKGAAGFRELDRERSDSARSAMDENPHSRRDLCGVQQADHSADPCMNKGGGIGKPQALGHRDNRVFRAD